MTWTAAGLPVNRGQKAVSLERQVRMFRRVEGPGPYYDRAQKEGPAFADGYRRLLADTGSMTSEEVAQKHLGVDLASRDFWDAAVKRILADVEPFVTQARDAG